ncbi:MAG: reverse transcriptase domain-containing protein [Candidatus Muiribacteriota bacterium]
MSINKLENFYILHKKSFEYALWHIRKTKYTTKKITKKSGKDRELNIPPLFTKMMQKKILDILSELYQAPKPVHGFIKSENDCTKNIISNAKQHVRKKIVINVDIENFFDTINFGRVRGMFLSKPFEVDEKIATRLAQLISHDNKLPQGAPTSPIVSNIICKRLDHQLIKIAKQYKLTYTRYADDITFSTNKIDIDIEKVITNIEQIINSNGFSINNDKTRVQRANHTQIVTGLKVNKKVNIRKKYKQQIRSMLYSWHKHGLEEATKLHFEKYNKQPLKYLENLEISFKNILIGKINFYGQVKGEDNFNYIRFRHCYYLLKNDFILKEKLNEFEELDITNLKRKEVLSKFIQIYDTITIFTEGETDIIYLKNALKFFHNKKKFQSLKLKFCNARGWVNVKNLHQVFYATTKELNILNMRKCILPHIQNNFSFCFILDADDKGIVNYFQNQKHPNYFLIDSKNNGYIEKLFDKSIIVKIINDKGYVIKPDMADDKTKKKLENHLSKNKEEDDIFSIDNYIVFKEKLIKKTDLAKYISKNENIDYSNFESVFEFLQDMEHSKKYTVKQCCDSIY